MLTKEGLLLKSRRVANNLEQKDLATLANTSQSQISRIERGQVRPSIKTLEKLFSAMNEELDLMIKKPTNPSPGANNNLMQGIPIRPKINRPKRNLKD